MSLISIIIPVYNVDQYLSRCLKSILDQTFQDFEVILVDDGSTDNSLQLCNEYAAKDHRITVLHQKNSGQAVARNNGLNWMFANSSNEYIAFIDSDDWIHPRYLELLLKALETSDADISQCLYSKEKEFKPFQEVKPEYLFISPEEQYIKWYNAFCWSKLYKKSCFNNIRFPEGIIYEDVALSYKLIFRSSLIAIVNCNLYFYNNRQGSTVHRDWTPRHFSRVIAWEDQRKYFSMYGSEKLISNVMERYLGVLCVQLKQVEESNAITTGTRFKYLFRIRYLIRKYLWIYGKTLECSKMRFFQAAYPHVMWCYWTTKGIIHGIRKRLP